jgi:hypothetical protein
MEESKRWKYNAARGGHAPRGRRDAFCEWVEDNAPLSDDEAKWLTGQLWNRTDVMPSSLCDDLDLRQGNAARKLRQEM